MFPITNILPVTVSEPVIVWLALKMFDPVVARLDENELKTGSVSL